MLFSTAVAELYQPIEGIDRLEANDDTLAPRVEDNPNQDEGTTKSIETEVTQINDSTDVKEALAGAHKDTTMVVLEDLLYVAEVIGDNSEMNQDPRSFVQQISERAILKNLSG